MTAVFGLAIADIPFRSWLQALAICTPVAIGAGYIHRYLHKTSGIDPAPQRRPVVFVLKPREEIIALECGHEIHVTHHAPSTYPCDACRDGKK